MSSLWFAHKLGQQSNSISNAISINNSFYVIHQDLLFQGRFDVKRMRCPCFVFLQSRWEVTFLWICYITTLIFSLRVFFRSFAGCTMISFMTSWNGVCFIIDALFVSYRRFRFTYEACLVIRRMLLQRIKRLQKFSINISVR